MNLPPVLILLAACAAAWADGGVTVPITLEKNLPLAQVKVNGRDLTFIIDSAAQGCVIDGQRAREIGLTIGAPAIGSGSGGRQAVELIHGMRLDIGGIPIAPPHPHTFDMAALKFQRRVDGVLGQPLFAGRVVEIDYPRLVMRIIPPKAYRPGPNIGGGFLKRYKVAFDFPGARVVITRP